MAQARTHNRNVIPFSDSITHAPALELPHSPGVTADS